jgi:Fe-S-cluster containining protein
MAVTDSRSEALIGFCTKRKTPAPPVREAILETSRPDTTPRTLTPNRPDGAFQSESAGFYPVLFFRARITESSLEGERKMAENPCVLCGACCAYFRVEFYWREEVPAELSEDLDDFHKCMKGTNQKRGQGCVALTGRVGKRAVCSIYEQRPTPCRAFEASWSNGKHNPRCDEARAEHGLKPLSPKDWKLQ